jgi:hypothetical protein
MRRYTSFLPDGTCFSVTARDAWDAKAKELAVCGVKSQASYMRYAEEVSTVAKSQAASRKASRMYG